MDQLWRKSVQRCTDMSSTALSSSPRPSMCCVSQTMLQGCEFSLEPTCTMLSWIPDRLPWMRTNQLVVLRSWLLIRAYLGETKWARQVKHGVARFATALNVLSNRQARPFNCKLDSIVRPSAIVGGNPPTKRDASFIKKLSNCSTPEETLADLLHERC